MESFQAPLLTGLLLGGDEVFQDLQGYLDHISHSQ